MAPKRKSGHTPIEPGQQWKLQKRWLRQPKLTSLVVGLAHDITDERDAENGTSLVRGSVDSTVTSLLYFCHSSQVMMMRC